MLSTISGEKNTDAARAKVLASLYDCYDSEKRNMCLKEIAAGFVAHNETDAVFQVMEENQRAARVFESCHVFLHFMGQAAYEKYGSVSEAFRHGSHTCFAGFYHGVLEGYFMQNNLLTSNTGSFDAIAKKMPSICTEPQSAGAKRDYNECLHGLGHGLMFATSGDLPQALKLCDALKGADAQWCYSGVFMENSTSTTNPDHPSRYLKKDDPLYPCDILDEQYLHTCYILQSMYFAQLANGDWVKISLYVWTFLHRIETPALTGWGRTLWDIVRIRQW